MEVFYKTFLETTDPNTQYVKLFSSNVVYCILNHVLLYTVAYFLLANLLNLSKKYAYFAIGITIIMILGYVGRLARVKSIYNVLLENSDKYKAREKSIEVIRNSYFTWYFLA